jgi:hypothetical protein
MTDIADLSNAAATLGPTSGPAMALAAVDLACTATGLLLGQAHDVPLLGCSAAVVSLDAAYAELQRFGGDPNQPRPPLVRETTEDAAAVVTAVIGLIDATAEALRNLVRHIDAADIALACSRALVQLDMAARFLRDDLP